MSQINDTTEPENSAVDNVESDDAAAAAAAFIVGHFDETLDAEMWLKRINVTPRDAAALLCRSNPIDAADDPTSSKNDETEPHDYEKMLVVFDDIAEADSRKVPRTLRDWHGIAASRGLKYHSWIDSYKALNPLAYGVTALAADAESTDEKGATDAAPPVPVVVPARKEDGWGANALRIADEIGLKKWNRGERQFSVRSISESVAAELGKGTTNNRTVWWGMQGPRSAGAIRTALKGWQFTPPNSGTNGISGTE